MKTDIDKTIVVIDDEPNALRGLSLNLKVAGYANVHAFTDYREAGSLWRDDQCGAVILDVIMPDCNGLDVLKQIKSEAPSIPVIMVTGVNEIDTAVNCLKNGAYDYLLKPIESERLVMSLQNAVRLRDLEKDYARLAKSMLSDSLVHPEAFERIHSRTESMLRLFKYVESVGPSSHPVLITGETGTGKELFAHAIHATSGRMGACICVNVAGLDDAMFSDTLFGHVKGAYTGAESVRQGLVESAADGTIFLDEIGDLSMQSQVKLLRVIQEKSYRPLGSDAERPCSARIVAATCRSIEELGAADRFRKDLYYRLRTHHIHLPPLRDRKADLPMLVEHFVKTAAKELGRDIPHIPSSLAAALNAYHFPGNVRELEAMLFDAMSNTHNGKLSLRSIHDTIGVRGNPALNEDGRVAFPSKLPSLKEVEYMLIAEAMSRSSGNLTVASELLGITRQTLAYRLKQRGS